MNTGEALDALHYALAAVYPTRRALSARSGRVSCVVVPESGEYEPAPCDTVSATVTAEVHVLAAGMDEKAAQDLPHHLEPVAALIRSAGWTPVSWRAGTALEQPIPVLIITTTTIATA